MDIKKITGVFCVTALMCIVMFFTISRTVHFLQITFPLSMQALAYPATACFDIGLLGWFFFATLAAEGALQRFTAYLMIFVCFVGVATTVVADIMVSSTANGVQVRMPPDISTVTLWTVSIIIVINIAAFPLVHIFSPKHLRHFATQHAKDIVIASSHKAIVTASQEIAPFVARQVSEQWKRDIVVEMLGYFPSGTSTNAKVVVPQIVDSLPVPKTEVLAKQEASLSVPSNNNLTPDRTNTELLTEDEKKKIDIETEQRARERIAAKRKEVGMGVGQGDV